MNAVDVIPFYWEAIDDYETNDISEKAILIYTLV